MDHGARGCERGGHGHGGGFGFQLGHARHDGPAEEERLGERCCERRGPRGAGRASLLEPAVLAAVADGGTHGYDVRGAIDAMTSGALSVDPGGLYRTLRRLEEDGLVVSEWTEGGSGPQRRTYQLTDDGRHALGHWAEHLRERERALTSVRSAVERAAGDEEAA